MTQQRHNFFNDTTTAQHVMYACGWIDVTSTRWSVYFEQETQLVMEHQAYCGWHANMFRLILIIWYLSSFMTCSRYCLHVFAKSRIDLWDFCGEIGIEVNL